MTPRTLRSSSMEATNTGSPVTHSIHRDGLVAKVDELRKQNRSFAGELDAMTERNDEWVDVTQKIYWNQDKINQRVSKITVGHTAEINSLKSEMEVMEQRFESEINCLKSEVEALKQSQKKVDEALDKLQWQNDTSVLSINNLYRYAKQVDDVLNPNIDNLNNRVTRIEEALNPIHAAYYGLWNNLNGADRT